MRADEAATWTAVPQHALPSAAPRREQPLQPGGAGPDDFLFHRLSSVDSGAGGDSVASVPPEDDELQLAPGGGGEPASGHESYDGGSFEPDVEDVGAEETAAAASLAPVRLTAPAPPAGLREDDLSLTARINAHLLVAVSRSAAELFGRDGAGATSAALQRAFAAHAALQRAEDEAWGGVDDRSDEGEDE
jgi:hypothetical protein